LGVPEATLAKFGAVSRQTAEAMAKGALERAGVDLTVSITGIAGPGGGSAEKPVGLVYLAAVVRNSQACVERRMLYGDVGRSEIRRRSVIDALIMLLELAVCLRCHAGRAQREPGPITTFLTILRMSWLWIPDSRCATS